MERNFENSLKNDPVSLKLRKSTQTLFVTGIGCMGYALWAVIRTVLEFYFRFGETKSYFTGLIMDFAKETSAYMDEDQSNIVALAAVILIIGIIIVVSAILFFIQFMTGLAACRDAAGKKTKILYIFAAFIIMLVELLNIYDCMVEIGNAVYGTNEYSMYSGLYTVLSDEIAGIIISLTSIIILLEMFVNAIRVRVLRKKPGGGNADEQ